LTATVATQSNGAAPTGSIQFFNGTTSLGTMSVTGGLGNTGFAGAIATISTSSLPQGTDSITATYSGDSNYTAGTSSAINVAVGVPGITVTPCSPATITVSQGSSGTCLITVTGANGFNGTVTLTAAITGGPSGAVYPPACNSFGTPDQAFTSPNTLTLNSSTTMGNATMTCATTAKTQLFGPFTRPGGRAWPYAGVGIALAGIFFLMTIRRQRRWGLVPLAVLLVVVVGAGVSCSGKGYGGGGNPGTTTGTYTATVTATPNSGLAQMTTVSVTVQ
jgi:hypothetical protein